MERIVLQRDLNMCYSNNKEYRQVLRQFFLMDPKLPEESENMDEESLDELLFDNKYVENIFDEIYKKTCKHIIFNEIYELGAACFIYSNKELGVAVLFSYDYFIFFYPLLCDFFDSSENLEKTNQNYIELKKQLSR